MDAAAGQLLLRPGLAVTCHGVAVTQPAPVSARAPLTVDTAVPTSLLPLGVVVSSDSRVRHMSPEVAKSLFQQQQQQTGWYCISTVSLRTRCTPRLFRLR